MYVIEARNVNDALLKGLSYLQTCGITEDSRNGPVLVAPGPVCTVYAHPWERVLVCPERDANPTFHLMEAIWMLAGRRDVAFVQQFNSRIAGYSDDNVNFHGAYGYRWRSWFGYDQLAAVAEELRRDPYTRRAVLTMWDSSPCNSHPPQVVDITDKHNHDHEDCEPGDWYALQHGGKDVPCNTHIYFDVRGGKLNMTVCCRSNDIWWGAYGANSVHFSVLQELMAVWVGAPMGLYRQFSNNYHLYTAVVPDLQSTISAAAYSAVLAQAYYDNEWENADMCGWIVKPTLDIDLHPDDGPQAATTFLKECEDFCIAPLEDKVYQHDFFNNTLRPMYQAYMIRKTKNVVLPESTGLTIAQRIQAPEWQYACMEWIARRELNKKETK